MLAVCLKQKRKIRHWYRKKTHKKSTISVSKGQPREKKSFFFFFFLNVKKPIFILFLCSCLFFFFFSFSFWQNINYFFLFSNKSIWQPCLAFNSRVKKKKSGKKNSNEYRNHLLKRLTRIKYARNLWCNWNRFMN